MTKPSHKCNKLVSIIAISFLTMLGSCTAPHFDNVEIMIVASIKVASVNGEAACKINPNDARLVYGKEIIHNADLYKTYSEHLKDNINSYAMAKELSGLVSDLDGNKPISETFCIDKFNLITMAADRILVALSRKVY